MVWESYRLQFLFFLHELFDLLYCPWYNREVLIAILSYNYVILNSDTTYAHVLGNLIKVEVLGEVRIIFVLVDENVVEVDARLDSEHHTLSEGHSLGNCKGLCHLGLVAILVFLLHTWAYIVGVKTEEVSQRVRVEAGREFLINYFFDKFTNSIALSRSAVMSPSLMSSSVTTL